MSVRRVADLDFAAVVAGPSTPSPSAWEDEVLYFLLVDRFSDGNEDGYLRPGRSTRRRQHPAVPAIDDGNAIGTPADAGQLAAGGIDRAGGTLAGLRSKLGYLRAAGHHRAVDQPGAQAGDPDRRVSRATTTATRPRTSSRSSRPSAATTTCAAWSRDAHAAGLRVVLDVVLNHAGDVFAYDLSDPRALSGERRFADQPGRSAVGRGGLPGRRLAVRIGALAPFTPAAAAASVAGRRRLPGRTACAADVLAQGPDHATGTTRRNSWRAISSV